MKKLLTALFALPLLFLLPTSSADVRDADREAVEAAVRDYVEGIYEVQPERIERSVHPAMVKRGSWRPEGSTEYRTASVMTFEQLVELAGSWNVDDQQGADLTYEIEVQDVLDITASAKLSAKWGIDYFHLMKLDDEWKIIHVLWQSHPPSN